MAQGTRFAALDQDGNGMLSFNEFTAALPQVNKEAFREADINSDDRLSHAEWSKAAPSFGFGRNTGVGKGQKAGKGSGKKY